MPLVRALTASGAKLTMVQDTVCVPVWRTIWREDAPGLLGLYKPSASGVNVSTNQVSSICFSICLLIKVSLMQQGIVVSVLEEGKGRM